MSNENKKKNQKALVLKLVGGAVLLVLIVVVLVALLLKIRDNAKESHIAAMGADVSVSSESKEEENTLSVSEEAEAPAEEPVVEEPVVEEPAFKATEAEAEDGSGAAGLMPMDESIFTLEYSDGWFRSNLNAWYSPDTVLCYYNGWQTIGDNTYHFDKAGMLDRGWKLIGGTGCYFDGDGVYHPEADPNKLLAFTFDDGPSDGTGQLLDLCEQTGARISFFLIGEQAADYGPDINRIITDRCLLGNHSTDHTQMIKLSTEDCVNNFRMSDSLICQAGGVPEPEAYRFPYGDYTPEQLAAIGKPGIMWSLDSLDWDLKNTDLVIQRVLEQVEEGDIILMHDLYDTTIEACRYLFPYLQEQGYQLVTVKELAAAKGFSLEAGKSYYSFANKMIEEGRVTQ